MSEELTSSSESVGAERVTEAINGAWSLVEVVVVRHSWPELAAEGVSG